ncbi:hypothetical protein PDE01_29520 [Paracoccus denitrificans]|nr:hypothetical protein PDE01_29520 [Paracoccus denitrificans]
MGSIPITRSILSPARRTRPPETGFFRLPNTPGGASRAPRPGAHEARGAEPPAAAPFRSRPPGPISCGQAARPTARRAERKPMSQKAMQRLSFFLLMGLTLYASFLGAG